MSDEQPRSLWSRLKWIAVVAWAVAGVKFALEFREQEESILFALGSSRWQAAIGVYYVMPVLLLIANLRGVFKGLGYGKLVLGMLLLAVLCWFVPNTIVYTTAQFKGWTHGRFAPGPPKKADPPAVGEVASKLAEEGPPARNAPVAKGTAGKILTGLGVAGGTTLFGFVWCFIWMNLLIYLPRRFAHSQ